MSNKFSNTVLMVLAFFAIYFVWGTTYLAIIVGLTGWPPFLMAAFRFLIAGTLLVTYSLVKGEGLPNRSALTKNAFIAIIVLVGGQSLLMWAEQYVPSGYAAVLIATLPIWFVIVDRAHWQLYFSNPYIPLGVIIGFIGIIILFRDKIGESDSAAAAQTQTIASLAVIAGAIFWVIGTLYNRSKAAPGSIFQNLGWQLLFGTIWSLIISFSFGEFHDFRFPQVGWQAWSAVVYLAIAGSIIAFGAYTWLLNKLPSAIVGTYAYINPMVAVFLGWLLADEAISSQQMLGMIIILTGAVVVNLSRSKVNLSTKQ